MPDLVRDDLFVRILHHIANGGSLGAAVHSVHGAAVKENLPSPVPRGGQNGFEMPQKGGLSAAAVAAEQHILPFFNGKGHILQALLLCPRIGKAQVSNFNLVHAMASRR